MRGRPGSAELILASVVWLVAFWIAGKAGRIGLIGLSPKAIVLLAAVITLLLAGWIVRAVIVTMPESPRIGWTAFWIVSLILGVVFKAWGLAGWADLALLLGLSGVTAPIGRDAWEALNVTNWRAYPRPSFVSGNSVVRKQEFCRELQNNCQRLFGR